MRLSRSFCCLHPGRGRHPQQIKQARVNQEQVNQLSSQYPSDHCLHREEEGGKVVEEGNRVTEAEEVEEGIRGCALPGLFHLAEPSFSLTSDCETPGTRIRSFRRMVICWSSSAGHQNRTAPEPRFCSTTPPTESACPRSHRATRTPRKFYASLPCPGASALSWLSSTTTRVT